MILQTDRPHSAQNTGPSQPDCAIGLRPPYFAAARKGEIAVDWLEIISENFMVAGGQPLAVLEDVRRNYPISLHGVSMNLGGTDPLDTDYLLALRALIHRFEPLSVSDHLCWTRNGGHHLHDLLPLPYAKGVIKHVAERICRVQDILGQQILIENLSSYAEFDWSNIREWEFITAVAEQADCLILLDLNNIVVSAHNHGFAPMDYLDAIPAERVAQHHLAGHSNQGPLKIDTHDQPVSTDVWDLYQAALNRFGTVPVCLERDDHLPPLNELLSELDTVRQYAAGRERWTSHG